MELQFKFWLIQGRQFVRTVIGQCRLCRRLESAGYSTQPSSPLPGFCTTMDYPFSYTGVDFVGPLYIKEGAATKKVYIALFYLWRVPSATCRFSSRSLDGDISQVLPSLLRPIWCASRHAVQQRENVQVCSQVTGGLVPCERGCSSSC